MNGKCAEFVSQEFPLNSYDNGNFTRSSMFFQKQDENYFVESERNETVVH